MPSPIVISFKGTELTMDEIKLFNKIDPVGFILFERNIYNKSQLMRLVKSLYSVGKFKKKFILIDQEGGRVARLRKPEWREMPPNYFFGKFFDIEPEKAIELLILNTQLLSHDLYEIGVNVNCSPVLDLFFKDSNKVIGDRSFHQNPKVVSKLAKIFCKTLIEGGVLPVLKHIPGHGRGDEDSHHKLPKVSLKLDELMVTDFLPFYELSDQPIAMTAHVLFTNLDREFPVSISQTVINGLIRDELGFEGLLLSDDISNNMKALGHNEEKNAINALNAGCDILLHCSGNLESMMKLSLLLPEISNISLARFFKAFNKLNNPVNIDYNATLNKYEDSLKYGKKLLGIN
ncbi:MAG: Beta-hexosaminidase A [Alphaproteobacteria bacterium MarineAlpha2_Bin1]|nr:MAG: Beta-hexosaminidase A [Alphaproteobacteria bacterium MarineAlpha2_Bin1]|tara:strand:+ start:651 stop:1688 length:1038 start_codon:yes stop_codon:yes gene_type:complete